MNERLLGLADDELVIGWRDSEWTGIAPLLEEDVAFSSIAQNEIGHARAVYQLLSEDADALAFDRTPEEYRCAPLVELRLLDWAHAIARRWLYEQADLVRITALKDDPDPAVAGLAAKIDREEAYAVASVGSKGDSYDNAMAESFFATLKKGHLFRERFQTKEEARRKLFEYLEIFYNRVRRHSALGYKSPVAFEKQLPTVA